MRRYLISKKRFEGEEAINEASGGKLVCDAGRKIENLIEADRFSLISSLTARQARRAEQKKLFRFRFDVDVRVMDPPDRD